MVSNSASETVVDTTVPTVVGVDAPTAEASGLYVPVRAMWAWPLATGLIGLVELGIQALRLHPPAHSVFLAMCTTFAMGLGVGMVHALLLILGSQRDWTTNWWSRRVTWLSFEHAWVSATFFLAVVLTGLAFAWVDDIDGALRLRSLPPQGSLLQFARFGIVFLFAPTILVCVVCLGLTARLLERFGVSGVVGRLCLTLLTLGVVVFASWTPHFLEFGPMGPWVILAAALLTTAVWLPDRLGYTQKNAILRVFGVCLPAFVLILFGSQGIYDKGARTVLLHDTRIVSALYRAMVSVFDFDGDGELPTWVGGHDCDNTDGRIATWRPEVPSNGIDDNCRLGDYTPNNAVGASGSSSTARHLPIVWISLSSVRPDRMELFDYGRATMPELAKYARRARVWRRAYAASGDSGLSLASQLRGQTPESLTFDGAGPQNRKVTAQYSLAARLREIGYQTVAVYPGKVAGGLPAGFSVTSFGPFDYRPRYRGTLSKQIVDHALTYLPEPKAAKPLFLWLTIPDARGTHEAHPHFGRGGPLTEYDNELNWIDRQLDRMLKGVHEVYGDEVIVIVAGDHGQAFGERGIHGHGFALYEPLVRVPLLIRAPNLRPAESEFPASSTRIASTVLELTGESPGSDLIQPSLLDASYPNVAIVETPYFRSEFRGDVALIEERWKLIHNRRDHTSVLFDLAADPHENRDLSEAQPKQLKRLEERLFKTLESLH